MAHQSPSASPLHCTRIRVTGLGWKVHICNVGWEKKQNKIQLVDSFSKSLGTTTVGYSHTNNKSHPLALGELLGKLTRQTGMREVNTVGYFLGWRCAAPLTTPALFWGQTDLRQNLRSLNSHPQAWMCPHCPDASSPSLPLISTSQAFMAVWKLNWIYSQ